MGAKSSRVLYMTVLSQQFSMIRYIMGHLSSGTALLCCDRIVQYSTLRFCAQSLLSEKHDLEFMAPKLDLGIFVERQENIYLLSTDHYLGGFRFFLFLFLILCPLLTRLRKMWCKF